MTLPRFSQSSFDSYMLSCCQHLDFFDSFRIRILRFYWPARISLPMPGIFIPDTCNMLYDIHVQCSLYLESLGHDSIRIIATPLPEREKLDQIWHFASHSTHPSTT